MRSTTGQILLTLGDTEERRRYLNARATIGTLLRLNAVPVINENDTVATTEIRYGDNDRLAARVATMVGADLLILLSDIDGLYTAPPHLDPKAEFLPVVDKITPAIEAMAGAAASEISRGGMKTKLDAGKIATAAGTCDDHRVWRAAEPAGRHRQGRARHLFKPSLNPVSAWKTWIAGNLEPAGRLTDRRRRIEGAVVRQVAAGCRGARGQRPFRARRYGRGHWPGRARGCARSGRL